MERPKEFWAPLGKTSSIPERLGVDFLTFSPVHGTVGIQRKELNDLVASLSDGRVAKEVIQMRELDTAIWLIEGRGQWSGEGQLMSARTVFTTESLTGVVLSLQSQGFWVTRTDSASDSMRWLSSLDRWMAKPKHQGLTAVPTARSMLGPPTDKDWAIHFLQSLPGLGYERARAIYEHYGKSPVVLRDGVDLTEVKGIGKVMSERIRKVLS